MMTSEDCLKTLSDIRQHIVDGNSQMLQFVERQSLIQQNVFRYWDDNNERLTKRLNDNSSAIADLKECNFNSFRMLEDRFDRERLDNGNNAEEIRKLWEKVRTLESCIPQPGSGTCEGTSSGSGASSQSTSVDNQKSGPLSEETRNTENTDNGNDQSPCANEGSQIQTESGPSLRPKANRVTTMTGIRPVTRSMTKDRNRSVIYYPKQVVQLPRRQQNNKIRATRICTHCKKHFRLKIVENHMKSCMIGRYKRLNGELPSNSD